MNDNIKFLKKMKEGLRRTISWNKFRSKITTQPKKKNNNLDSTFWNNNILFVCSFTNDNSDATITSFGKYYVPLVQIQDFNALFNNK